MPNGGRAFDSPNIMIILNDDMGFSDIGCYGGEIETPNLDRLAANGLRYSQFYNTARCSPSRASLLTGLHPHQTGIGILTYSNGPEGYAGNLNKSCVTVAEVLKQKHYKTYLSGKWHIASSLTEPTDAWPLQRGFDYFFGTIIGAGSFYNPNTLTRGNDNIEHEAEGDPSFFYTDAISDQAVAYIRQHKQAHPETPFFQYVAYTAPHWPLHAHEEDIAKYRGRFDEGWTSCASNGCSGWSMTALFIRIGSLQIGTRPSRRGRRRRIANGPCAAWRSTPPRSTAWIRELGASSRRWRKPASLKTP